MEHLGVAPSARIPLPISDQHDRRVVRHLLTLTPAERLQTLSAFWPVMSVGLRRRSAAGGAHRP